MHYFNEGGEMDEVSPCCALSSKLDAASPYFELEIRFGRNGRARV